MNESFGWRDLRLFPLAIFLFALPYAHTVALRLTTLFVAGLIALLGPGRQFKSSDLPLKLPLVLWATMALLSVAWAQRPDYSLQEIRNEIGYSVVAFLVCFGMVATERAWRFYCGVLVAGFIAISCVGLHWFANGYDQYIDAPHGGVGHYSTYLVTILPLLMAITIGVRSRGTAASVTGVMLLLLLLLDGYGTGNRAFWPATILSILSFALLYALRAQSRQVRLRVFTLAATVLILAAAAFAATLENRAGRTNDAVVNTVVDDPRFPIWDYAAAKIASHPLTGGGFGRGVYAKEFTEHFQRPDFWHGHNLVLNYGLQMGIGGIAVLVILFGAIAREFWLLYRSADAMANLIGLAGIAMLIGFVAKNMTDDFFVRQNSLMFWSIVGLSLGYGRRRAAGTLK